MAIKVHGVAGSPCTRVVLMALIEKNVPYELVSVDVKNGEHKQPPFLAKQPFGKVPVLEDDGFFVYESRAIAKYITKKYAGQGTKLYPDESNLKGFAMFEQACSLEENYFHVPAEGIAYEKIHKLMKGEGPTDEAQVVKYAARLDSTLAVYDRILSKQKYLAGDEVTLADLLHLPYGKIVKALGFKGTFEKYANVDKWFVALEARESWIKVDL